MSDKILYVKLLESPIECEPAMAVYIIAPSVIGGQCATTTGVESVSDEGRDD